MNTEQLKALGVIAKHPNIMHVPFDAALGAKSISRTIENDYYTHSDLMKVEAAYEARIAELEAALKHYGDGEHFYPDSNLCDLTINVCIEFGTIASQALSKSSPLTALEEHRKRVLNEAADWFDMEEQHPVGILQWENEEVSKELRNMAEEAAK